MTRTRHVDTGSLDEGSWSTLDRSWEVQPKPFTAPLPFRLDKFEVSGYTFRYNNGHDYVQATSGLSVGGSSHDLIPDCINRAYGKLVENLGDTSQWANNLFEGRESVGMIATRAFQLATAAKALRRLDFRGVAKALTFGGHSVKKGFVPKAKNFGDQWLEYHFGWEPAIQDIHNACQTMSKADFGSRCIRSSHTLSETLPPEHVHGGSVANPYDSFRTQSNTFHVKQGATVRISNPNAYLANQFGVVNPLSIAWEAVPFSFVVDWFANVGQVMSSVSDFVGVDVQNAYTTFSTEIRAEYRAYYDHPNPNIGGSGHYSAHAFKVERSPGISGPSLRVKPFKGFSAARGATAISLLLQQLRR